MSRMKRNKETERIRRAARKTRRGRHARLGIAVLALAAGALLLIHVLSSRSTGEEESFLLPREPEPVRVVSTATIGTMGDLLIHSPFLTYYNLGGDNWDFDGIFTHVSPYIRKLDYAAINFEGTISTQARGYSAYPMFKLPAAVADSVSKAGFDLALTANNHIGDGGEEGFLYTIQTLRDKKLDTLGSRLSDSEPKYLIRDINGIQVGMVNWTYGQLGSGGSAGVNGNPLSTRIAGLAGIFDYGKLDAFYGEQQALIGEMRSKGAEVIIYFMHWGDEYQIQQNAVQSSMARQLCNLGVDAIVGGHPHVIQPIEVLQAEATDHKMVCLYSLGNAVSNQRVSQMDLKTGHTEDGVLFQLTYSKQSDGKVFLSGVGALPTWVNLYVRDGQRHYEIVPIDQGTDWTRFLNSPSVAGSAEASYARTMELLGPGLEACKAIVGTAP